jgi:hypothetical protein
MAKSNENDDIVDDLYPVLQNIAATKFPATREKIANQWETRAFLDIGLELLREDLLDYSGPNLAAPDRSRLFESLSRERILARAASRPDGSPESLLSASMYRGRWEHKNRFTEDLIAYLFRLGPQQHRLDVFQDAARDYSRTLSLGQLVRSLASLVTETVLQDPISALQISMESALPRHPRVREFTKAQYELVLPRWAQIYEEIATAYRFTINPPSTWMDVSLMLNATMEGYVMRSRMENFPLQLSSGDNLLAGVIISVVKSLTTVSKTANLDELFAS